MTDHQRLSFNLVIDPWLPVTLTDGSAATWGMREFFARVHEARGLNEPSPLTYTAVLRFLLAVLHRAIDGPEDPVAWLELWHKGRLETEVIDAYLGRWQHRFDLFDPQRPFAQVDAGAVLPDDSPATRLFMERTSGNNPTLFDHSWDAAAPPLAPAEAARALLTAHAYGFAGSGGRFFNSPMIAGYCITLEGHSLFETLLLNTQEYSDERPTGLERTDDAPWWELPEDPPARSGGNDVRGLTDILTWRSRSLQLKPKPDGTVRRVAYAQRYVVRDPEYTLRDPFKHYVMARTGTNKGVSFPRNFSAGRALWRDSAALLEEADRLTPDPNQENQRPGIINWIATLAEDLMNEEGEEFVPTIVATGLVNTQAKIDLWRMDRLPLPIRILRDTERRIQVGVAITRAQEVRDALNVAGTVFASEGLGLGDRKPDPGDVRRERSALQLDERYWSQLDARFQRFMVDLAHNDDPAAPLTDWTRGLRALAQEVFVDATNVAGLDGRWFRAQAIGARTLDQRLQKALPSLYETDEPVTARSSHGGMQ